MAFIIKSPLVYVFPIITNLDMITHLDQPIRLQRRLSSRSHSSTSKVCFVSCASSAMGRQPRPISMSYVSDIMSEYFLGLLCVQIRANTYTNEDATLKKVKKYTWERDLVCAALTMGVMRPLSVATAIDMSTPSRARAW